MVHSQQKMATHSDKHLECGKRKKHKEFQGNQSMNKWRHFGYLIWLLFLLVNYSIFLIILPWIGSGNTFFHSCRCLVMGFFPLWGNSRPLNRSTLTIQLIHWTISNSRCYWIRIIAFDASCTHTVSLRLLIGEQWDCNRTIVYVIAVCGRASQ